MIRNCPPQKQGLQIDRQSGAEGGCRTQIRMYNVDAEDPDVNEYQHLPDTEALAERLRVCLQVRAEPWGSCRPTRSVCWSRAFPCEKHAPHEPRCVGKPHVSSEGRPMRQPCVLALTV